MPSTLTKQTRTATGERRGRRATDAEEIGQGVGAGREGQGRGDVPGREQAQVAVAEHEPKTSNVQLPRGGNDGRQGQPAGVVTADRASSSVTDRNLGGAEGDVHDNTSPVRLENESAKASVTSSTEPRDTSVRNAATAIDRATHGMDDLPEVERKGWEASKAEAAQAMAKDPDYARNLAREVLQSKRPITDAETMALGADRTRLNERFDKAEEDIVHAMDNGDTAAELRARAERETALDDLDVNHRATQSGGTALARAMAARNAQMTKDYSGAGLVRRARVAFGDKIAPETEAKLADLAKQIAEKDKTIAAYEAKASKAKLDANVREQAKLQKQIAEMEDRLAKRLKACPI
jgi:hypothetical protein